MAFMNLFKRRYTVNAGIWRDDRRVMIPVHLVRINELLAGDKHGR